MPSRLPTLLLLAIWPGLGTAGAQRPLNLDFEQASAGSSDRPWGWTLGWSAFGMDPGEAFALDTLVRRSGARALRITASDSGAGAPSRDLMLQVPAAFARGATLELRGWMRTRDLTGRAFVALEAWGDRVVPAGDSAVTRAMGTASSDWHEFTLRIDVPRDATIHSIVFLIGVQGRGTAWFDGLSLRINGAPTAAVPASAPEPTAAQLAWLATRSTPLRSVAVATGDSDLVAFDRIIGSARMVALGESTHGTREFFQLKHRLLAHLVERHDFDVFAIEANQRAVESLNRYVQHGDGTARQAMRSLFAVWNTEEVLALVEWVRAHNLANPGRKVRFIGYDMQDHRLPIDSLLAYARRHDPGLVERITALTARYRAEGGYATPHLPEDVRTAWARQADSLVREVTGRREAWLGEARSRADTIAAEWAAHDAELYRQAARLNETLNSPDRDSLMAANLDWAARTLYPGSRIVVWAHDVHVSRGGDRQRSFNAGAQMGAHLEHSFHHDYRAFSLLTTRGAYRATRSFTDHAMIAAPAFEAPASSVESVLARLPRPQDALGILIDLRVDEHDPDGAWLWAPRPIRHIGYAAYDYGFDLTAVMPLEFHGVFLIDVTSPSRPVP